MFENYIQQLLKKIPKHPYKLDIVMGGGCFNGLYGIGVLLFIKQMEKQGYVIINRFSGVSAGALACFFYLIDDLDNFVQYYSLIKKSLRKNQNMTIIKKILESINEKMDDTTFQKIKKNKFYIGYHDVKKKKQIIKSKYTNKEDLKKALLKSSHIPYLMNNQCLFHDSSHCFIDGGLPYIFPERERNLNTHILYISITQISTLKNMLYIKNESVYGRITDGILDAYKFFLHKKPTKFCSFINQWYISDFIYLRLKKLTMIIFCYIIEIGIRAGHIIKPLLCRCSLYKKMTPVLYEMYRDILLYSLF